LTKFGFLVSFYESYSFLLNPLATGGISNGENPENVPANLLTGPQGCVRRMRFLPIYGVLCTNEPWTGKEVHMYKGLFSFLIGVMFSVFVVNGASAEEDLASYEPKSPAEAEIKECMLDFLEAYNGRDLDRCLAHVHENAKYQKSGPNSWVSKKDLPRMWGGLWSQGLHIGYGTPEITIDEDQAVIKLPTPYDLPGMGQGVTLNTYTLVREGDSWLIIERERKSVW
jgi:hypothetical protein